MFESPAPPGKYQHTCPAQLPPGASCSISCRAPYEGNSSEAMCPDPNTLKDGPVQWDGLDCLLLCPEMDLSQAPNYTLEAGELQCVEGAVGMAMAECRIEPESCRAFWHFSGCLMLQPCVLPPLDPCRTDQGNCSKVFPGEFCILSCQEQFLGSEVIARCPVDNTNTAERLQLDQALTCHCMAPLPRPGYELVSAAMDGGEWRCGEGWTGTAMATCQVVPPSCQPNVSGKQSHVTIVLHVTT